MLNLSKYPTNRFSPVYQQIVCSFYADVKEERANGYSSLHVLEGTERLIKEELVVIRSTPSAPQTSTSAHPEYFSQVNGKRLKDHTQLWLTNPDVLRIVTSNVLARIRKDPGASFYGVSQNDWYNYCTCPDCKALDDAEESHAGTMIAFVNKIAEAVEKEFPNVIIATLAYQYTRKPPKTIRPRANVMPCLCTIECDFSFPITVSAFKENRAFLDDIRGWNAICKQLYVWDYTTNFRDYTSPFPNVLALQGNVQFFHTNRVDYLFEQGAYQGRHGDFAELKAWLLAKWLWNPDLPAEPLLQDFFKGYYGAAGCNARKRVDRRRPTYIPHLGHEPCY